MSQKNTTQVRKLETAARTSSNDRLSNQPLRSSTLVSAVGRLLSSQELRDEFKTSPEKVARRLNIATEDLATFASLDSVQLQRQADTLLNKRWHEVRRLVPVTINELGDGADEVFRFYASNDWPVGHRRHPVDALRFLQFLITNQIHEPNQAELRRMRRVGSLEF